MTSRRTFLRAAAASLLSVPVSALAQPATKLVRIGWLTPDVFEVHTRAFREAMRALGDVEGQAYTIESRSADGNLDRLRYACDRIGCFPSGHHCGRWSTGDSCGTTGDKNDPDCHGVLGEKRPG